MRFEIKYFVVIGDSLSDPGKMSEDRLLEPLSGLAGNSPDGAFTNGLPWNLLLAAKLAPTAPTDANADRIAINTSQIFMRTYCKGGLTAHNYQQDFTLNPIYAGSRFVLSHLEQQYTEICSDDSDQVINSEAKKKTLVIEWSGANDLITVNEKPTQEAAYKAVNARIEHIEKMVAQGYCHFVLFNLPDLSLTPRFQNGHSRKTAQENQQERDEAAEVVTYFNQLLQDRIDVLQKQWQTLFPECSVHLYDINTLFTDAYQNPTKYKLAENKKRVPLIRSSEFVNTDDQKQAEGYMFWDEVHPTTALHVEIMEHFYRESFQQHYEFHIPHDGLVDQFRAAYGIRWETDRESWRPGYFSCSNIAWSDPKLTLDDVLKHAQHEKGHRTLEVITELGWFGPRSTQSALVDAMKRVSAQVLPNNRAAFFSSQPPLEGLKNSGESIAPMNP